MRLGPKNSSVEVARKIYDNKHSGSWHYSDDNIPVTLLKYRAPHGEIESTYTETHVIERERGMPYIRASLMLRHQVQIHKEITNYDC